MTLAGLLGLLIALAAFLWLIGLLVFIINSEMTDSYAERKRKEDDNRLRWKLRDLLASHEIDPMERMTDWRLGVVGLVFGVAPLVGVGLLFLAAAQVPLS